MDDGRELPIEVINGRPGKTRDTAMGGNDEREQTLNQLLAEMDGFDTNNPRGGVASGFLPDCFSDCSGITQAPALFHSYASESWH